MSISLVTVGLVERRPLIVSHLQSLGGPIDSFYEDHVNGATCYRILVDGEAAGLAAIHDESTITLFAVDLAWLHCGQDLFAKVRRTENVRAALVPSSDEVFLVHAMDDFRRVSTQSHAFIRNRKESGVSAPRLELSLATPDDVAVVRDGTGAFFEPVEDLIAGQKLHLVTKDGVLVGFGVVDPSRYLPATASIGPFVLEAYRNRGLGKGIIRCLIDYLDHEGITPVAGCWFYNHVSKQTLERAGMSATGRLLRFEF